MQAVLRCSAIHNTLSNTTKDCIYKCFLSYEFFIKKITCKGIQWKKLIKSNINLKLGKFTTKRENRTVT